MVCGADYKHTAKATRENIHARLKDGYTEDDFKTVIDKKFAEWKGTEWEKYLRPQTLFRPSNFEGYLNQKVVKEKPKNKFNDFPQREYGFDELERQLLSNNEL